tara:strand:- start:2218 stop:2748 length:531 start_codon:yes stop_codon:yes gene_type:complete
MGRTYLYCQRCNEALTMSAAAEKLCPHCGEEQMHGVGLKSYGLLLAFSLVYAAYLSVEPFSEEEIQVMTVGSYLYLDDDDRDFVLYTVTNAGGVEPKNRVGFAACVNDFAINKSLDLLVTEIFGWCVFQFEKLPGKFAAHIDPFAKFVPLTAKERREMLLYCLSEKGLSNPDCLPQ